MKILYTPLLRKGDQKQIRRFQDPEAFDRILETIVLERICYIYKKNKTRLLRVHGTPFRALIGLIDNQHYLVSANIVLETLQQDPQETQVSDTLETNKLPQQKQTLAPMGSDDIIISEELEQVEDLSPSDPIMGCKKEIDKKEEPSPEPLKAT